jgi:hypothetical protein
MFTTHIVTSQDGVKFSVQFESANAASAEVTKIIEENFAKRRTATELDKTGAEYGYHRIATQEPVMKLFLQTSALTAALFLAILAPIVLMGYGN